MPNLFRQPGASVAFLLSLALLAAACGGEPTAAGDRGRGPLLAVGRDTLTGADITTDKDDYSPGDTIHLTGSGWAPNEPIHLAMTEEPDTHEDVAGDVQADSAGSWSLDFYVVQDTDLGVTFTLTSSGTTSGSLAIVIFTDAINLKVLGADNLQHQNLGSEENLGSVAQGTDLALTCPRGTGLTISASGVGTGTQAWALAYGGTGADNGTLAALSTLTPNNGSVTGSSDSDCSALTITTGTLTVGTTYHGSLLATGTGAGDGPYFFRFTVAAPANTAPVLDAIGNQSVLEGTPLSFTATANDDGNPAPPALTFTLETPGAACLLLHPQVPVGATITSGGAFSWTPSEAEGPGVYCARVQVSDGALTDFEDFTVTVTEGNAAPVLDAIGDQQVDELVLLSFSASANDSDIPAQTLTFSLGTPSVACGHPIAAGASITSGGAFTWTPTEAQGPGTYCARIQVSDGTDSDFEEIKIDVAEVNLAPVLTAIGNQQVDELVLLSFTATANDSDIPAQTLTFSLGTPSVGCGYPIAAGASITSGGAFTWTPTEAQGPGTYCARIQVSDGTDSDFEEIEIAVAEVNLPPVLTVPADFSIPWGQAVTGKSASATDPDLPANGLSFSLITYPAGMTISASTGAISWTPTSGQVGPHTVKVRVTDDGAGALYDEDPTFTITVIAHATSLVYNGSTSGQYSDQAKLSATLTDDVTNTAISGETVDFTFNASVAGSDATDLAGKAEVLYTVIQAAGSYTVAASYAGSALYDAAGPTSTSFTVNKENASIFAAAANVGAIPVAQTTVTLIFNVKETNPEPTSNDGALAGDIGKVTSLTATLMGVATGPGPSGVCTAQAVSGTGYSAVRPFSCLFTGPFAVDAFTINLSIPSANGYYTGSDEDVLSVYDPNAGFVTGGGKFIDTDGLRVSFGMSFTYTGKGKTGYRGGWVVVKHLAAGGVCRVKSNTMNAPSVNLNTASLSGKSNYSCVDATGATTASAGNLAAVGWVLDGGTSGINQDKFWIAAGSAAPMLNMPPTGPTNAKLLTGGNIQVPQPSKP